MRRLASYIIFERFGPRRFDLPMQLARGQYSIDRTFSIEVVEISGTYATASLAMNSLRASCDIAIN